jgi:hypothetical protein
LRGALSLCWGEKIKEEDANEEWKRVNVGIMSGLLKDEGFEVDGGTCGPFIASILVGKR